MFKARRPLGGKPKSTKAPRWTPPSHGWAFRFQLLGPCPTLTHIPTMLRFHESLPVNFLCWPADEGNAANLRECAKVGPEFFSGTHRREVPTALTAPPATGTIRKLRRR